MERSCHGNDMIAPTARHRKGRAGPHGTYLEPVWNLFVPGLRNGDGTAQRHTVTGSLVGIIVSPLFRPATAALHCDKIRVRWPGPFGSGFLSPQPPGVVGIGPVRTTEGTNASWSFFCLCQSVSASCHCASAQWRACEARARNPSIPLSKLRNGFPVRAKRRVPE